MRPLRKGTEVEVNYFAGHWIICYYIKKTNKTVMPSKRGTYCVLSSGGQTRYVRPKDITATYATGDES